MVFKLKKLFVDVFAPQSGDIVSIMYDLPFGAISDHKKWQERRKMADDWHRQIVGFSRNFGMHVNPIITYNTSGSHNAYLPEYGLCKGESIRIEDIIKDSTIVISMPQFSASAPLLEFTRKYQNLRVASMPMVTKSMEETGLSADYKHIAATCARIAPLFERANGIFVMFSTGHICYFDISDHKRIYQDNGLLHPNGGKDDLRFANLPAGEVFTCPNEAENSLTYGEIPAVFNDETIVFEVKNNQVIEVKGDGLVAKKKRQEFQEEIALRNIAEVAIGCNNKAAVTGNVLEDEKAGFHWAYGRSGHFGGTIGVEDFSSPEKVCHMDIVYAKDNPIVCSRFDFIFHDGKRKTAIKDGQLII